MKYNIQIAIIILFFSAFACNKLIAQANGDSLQIIISNTKKSKELFEKTKAQILSMPHVIYIAYCSNHNLFLLYADKSYYTDKETFFKNLVSLTKNNEFILKQGLFKDIINFCDYDDTNEYDAVKKLIK